MTDPTVSNGGSCKRQEQEIIVIIIIIIMKKKSIQQKRVKINKTKERQRSPHLLYPCPSFLGFATNNKISLFFCPSPAASVWTGFGFD